jgi:hypothetical protein
MSTALDNAVAADPRVLRGIWAAHLRQVDQSLQDSRRLLEAEQFGPAFVWAVRAMEIFVRECLLFPAHYERLGDLDAALRAATKAFGSGNWAKSLAWASEVYGPFDDEPLTDSDENAWKHWKTVAVRHRGRVVHGQADASAQEVEWVIAYAERFRSWWAQRLAVYDRGPLRGVLRDAIAVAAATGSEKATAEDDQAS